MIVSIFQYIREDTKVDGLYVPTAIQILPIMLCLIALRAMLTHTGGEIIQMHNVINVIQEEHLIKATSYINYSRIPGLNMSLSAGS
jgi:hypothetical protein